MAGPAHLLLSPEPFLTCWVALQTHSQQVGTLEAPQQRWEELKGRPHPAGCTQECPHMRGPGQMGTGPAHQHWLLPCQANHRCCPSHQAQAFTSVSWALRVLLMEPGRRGISLGAGLSLGDILSLTYIQIQWVTS